MGRSSRRRAIKRESYLLPFRYTRGTLAELLFWHAIYFLMGLEGESSGDGGKKVLVTYSQMTAITGLSRKTIRKLLDQGLAEPKPYTLTEEEGIQAYSYLLKLPCFQQAIGQKRAIIPATLIRHKWTGVLSSPPLGQARGSRFPIAILTLFLKLPGGKRLSISEIAARIKRRDQRKAPDPIQVKRAINYLVALSLLHVDPSQTDYRLNHNQLAQDGPSILDNALANLSSPSNVSPIHQELIIWASQQDANRTELTLELIKRGNFHLETHFKEIFHDVGKISVENDLGLLYYAIDRHRNRPFDLKRWENCFQLFVNKLDQHSTRIQSKKISISLNTETQIERQLRVVIQDGAKIRWGKCVIWINDHANSPFFTQDRYSITLKLSRRLQLIWSQTVTYEYERLKIDLTGELHAGGENLFDLLVETPTPLPTIRIQTYIEVFAVKGT